MRRTHLQGLVIPLSIFIASSVAANDMVTPFRFANVIIPASFSKALAEGLVVPIRLQYQDPDISVDTLTDDAIGYASLILKDEQLYLNKIDFSISGKTATLNQEIINNLSNDELRAFSSDGEIFVNEHAFLKIDLIKMLLTINAKRDAFGYESDNAVPTYLTSSVDEVTSVNRYNMGYSFYRNSETGVIDSNFMQLDSMIGFKEHHLALNGSLYNLGESQQNGKLYRAMYERDLEDRRIAGGMVTAWDLQSLGGISALNSGRIYGGSYGNHARSRQQKTSESTTPIRVFMPSAGEVRVYREGRMIGLQNLPIGNHDVDTTNFPGGVYNVTVEVYTDGRLVETTNQRVTKLGGSTFYSDALTWQWWGGVMDSTPERNSSPLLGVSLAQSFESVNMAFTSYGFNDAAVSETQLGWQAGEKINLQMQTMFATDGSWRLASTQSLQLMDNISLWANQEKQNNGRKLTVSESELYSTGLSVNLGGWVDRLGQLTFSTTHDRVMHSDRSYLDYSQSLYSGRYGTLSFRGSLQSNSGTFSGFDNRSITLDYSIPLDNLFSFGLSSNEQGQSIANLNYHKRMDGVINLASLNSSRVMHGNNQDDMSVSGTLGFNHDLIGGTMSLGRGYGGDINGNLIARGSLATTSNHLVASSQSTSDAGVVINTGISRDGQMLAKVNGQDYPLKGETTFLALSPYQEYEIELLNSKKSKDSYEITAGKQTYTLFPGNVATLDAGQAIREMVTVFGVMRAEDGTLITNARLDNHIGTTATNEKGEFSLDVDKANPMLTFKQEGEYCEAALDIRYESGAAWVGDVICRGLPTYAMVRGN